MMGTILPDVVIDGYDIGGNVIDGWRLLLVAVDRPAINRTLIDAYDIIGTVL